MRLKKWVSLGLAATMAMTSLTACAGKESSKETAAATTAAAAAATTAAQKAENTAAAETTPVAPESNGITFPLEEKMTFECMAYVPTDDRLLSDNHVWNWLQERANVEIDLVMEIPKAEASEKANLLLASGDYPDFLFKFGSINHDSYGKDGVFIPLEDMIREHMPYLCELLDRRDAWPDITATDGHIYALPKFTQPMWQGRNNAVMYMSEKWLANVGLEMPTTMEEFYQVLKAFKEQDANGNGDPNDEIPLMVRGLAGNQGITTLQVYMGGVSHYYGDFLAVNDSDELIFYPYDDLYREWLEWMIRFYEEGLLYENSLVQTQEQMKALFKESETDIVGAFTAAGTGSYLHDQYSEEYVAVASFDVDRVARSKGITTGGLAITDKCENPEVLLAYFDYLYGPEGSLYGANGMKEEAWTVREDGAIIRFDDIPYESESLQKGEVTPLCADYKEWGYLTVNEKGENTDEGLYAEGRPFYGGIYLPTLSLTEEEDESIAVIRTDLEAYLKTFNSEMITGVKELNDDTWNEFHANLKKMGADKYLEAYQAAYGRATAK